MSNSAKFDISVGGKSVCGPLWAIYAKRFVRINAQVTEQSEDAKFAVGRTKNENPNGPPQTKNARANLLERSCVVFCLCPTI